MYYPELRPVAEMIRIQRRTLLPEYAIGRVEAELGSIVDVLDTVARGLVPSRHIIIEAASELGVDSSDVEELLLVNMNRPVEEGDVIAGKDVERGRRVFAPLDGVVVAVDDGRIIMQSTPQRIDLKAGVRGQVVQVIEGRGVAIEATGAVLQGVWGNDKRTISSIRFEPEDGLEEISDDDISTTYRGDIVITKTQLTEQKIHIAQVQQMTGIIAPSMDASLEQVALNANIPIMITSGFGDGRFYRHTLQLLETFEGYQGVLDAAYPNRYENRRAELMIHQHSKEEIPAATSIPLREGMIVRVTRPPYAGRNGEVVEVPRNRITLANGLSVYGAYVEMAVDEIVAIPLANLEVTGT